MGKNRLRAAITASGVLVCLNLAADGHVSGNQADVAASEVKPLPLRVEELRAKFEAASTALQTGGGGSSTRVNNIVQFFNFMNGCFGGAWRNC
jgi:hypothetical protein